jgi:hypothetical protein
MYYRTHTNHFSAESHFPLERGKMGKMSVIFKHGCHMVNM